MKRIYAAITAIMLATLSLLWGCAGNHDLPGGSGLIEADETLVSAETSGRVLSRAFDEGTDVSIGDTLLVIDPSRIELQLASARAGRDVLTSNLGTARLQVKQAKVAEDYAGTEYARIDKLLKSGTANQQQMDKVTFERDRARLATRTADAQVASLEAQLTQTDAQIAQLERQLEDCYPISPANGVVTDKFVDAGEFLAPGKAIAQIARLDTVWVKVYLPTAEFAQVRLGDKAKVSTESGGQEFDGTVVWTSESAEFTPKNVQTEESRADLVYAVKVRIGNPDGFLKIGMPVYVTLEK